MKHGCLLAAAIALGACASPSSSPSPCAVPGELLHWQADYCLFEAETDDIIAAGPCLERESGKRFRNACNGKRHYKRAMCEQSVAAGYRPGSVDSCVEDPLFMGRTVRNGGA